jgi:hypothetical protein
LALIDEFEALDVPTVSETTDPVGKAVIDTFRRQGLSV